MTIGKFTKGYHVIIHNKERNHKTKRAGRAIGQATKLKPSPINSNDSRDIAERKLL